MVLNTGQPDIVSVQSGVIQSGAWSHAVGTWDGTTARLYINGALADEMSMLDVDHLSVTTLGTSIGGGFDTRCERCILGEIDEVVLFDRALSESEIGEIHTP